MYHIHYYILSVSLASLQDGRDEPGLGYLHLSIYHISDVYTTHLAPSLFQFTKGHW